MLNWILNAVEYLEPLYYLASIALFASVIIGLYQLKLLKTDIRNKNKRAAMEKSLEYLDWFSSEFFPSMNHYRNRYYEIRDKMIENASDETKKRLIDGFKRQVDFDIKPNDTFSKDTDELKPFVVIMSCMESARSDIILNQLEFFSAAMVSGLADEKLAFNPLSDAYCVIIEDLYIILCKYRGENSKLYSNIVKLYGIWKSRINKQILEGQHREISEQISQIADTHIKPFGI